MCNLQKQISFLDVAVGPNCSGNANWTQMNERNCHITASAALNSVKFWGDRANTVFYHRIELYLTQMYCFSSN